jgi:hypothetical protein
MLLHIVSLIKVTDVWDALTYLDADPDKDGYVVEIYSDKSTPADNNVDANGWNREHVFPKSYGNC